MVCWGREALRDTYNEGGIERYRVAMDVVFNGNYNDLPNRICKRQKTEEEQQQFPTN